MELNYLGEEMKNPSVRKAKTGIIHDPQTLLHKSEKNHPECPNRVVSIIQNLIETKLTDQKNVELVSSVPPATRSQILLAHSENYIEQIDDLWPERCQKQQIYAGDTYFNKDSAKCAYLSAGGTILGIDKIMNNEWENGFSVMRPPGHHSREASSCTGFCFFNNAVIGAKYLQTKYNIKKVLIFDWDVHFGDGSAHLLQEDNSILYMSYHRFDKGQFYPGGCGSVRNVGINAGKGFNLNFPWDIDHVSKPGGAEIAGDQEYIYNFELISVPIIKQFKPEFIIISCGFDSALNDPLGGLGLTTHGYSYLTLRLKELALKNRVLVVLEGGYNLESLKWASESVVRTLIGEDFPLKMSQVQWSTTKILNRLLPNSVGLSTSKVCLEEFQQYWPCLKEQATIELQERVMSNISKQKSLSGGHMESIQFEGNLFMKKAKKGEIKFYESLRQNDEFQSENKELLEQFIPKFIGIETKDDVSYLKLENVLSGFKNPWIIDIKLGTSNEVASKSDEKNQRARLDDKKSSSKNLGFRITGLATKFRDGTIKYKSSKLDYTTEKILPQLEKFFTDYEEKLRVDYVEELLKFTKQFQEFYKNRSSRRFVSSSIFMVVDYQEDKSTIKLIDFNYVFKIENSEEREQVLIGLNTLISYLDQLKAQGV